MNMRWCIPSVPLFVALSISQSFGAEPLPPVQVATSAFRDLCATGPLTPSSIFARAATQGWRSSGGDAPKAFNPSTQRFSPTDKPLLLLQATSEISHEERHDLCSVAISIPTEGLERAVESWLGFPPFFAMGRSATFIAVRRGDRWQSGTALDRSAFGKAKARGEVYTIMVGDRGSEEADAGYPAQVILMHVQPVDGSLATKSAARVENDAVQATGLSKDQRQDCLQGRSPAEILDLEDQFRNNLSAQDRARLDRALPRAKDGRVARCEQRDGTSCDAYVTMAALISTDLLRPFFGEVCLVAPSSSLVPSRK